MAARARAAVATAARYLVVATSPMPRPGSWSRRGRSPNGLPLEAIARLHHISEMIVTERLTGWLGGKCGTSPAG